MKTRVYAARGTSSCSVDGCENDFYSNSFCKNHHEWHRRRGLLPKAKEITIRQKLLQNIKKDKDGCWIWQKGKNNRGYGTISLPHQKKAYAHRVSYEIFKGEIPQGMCVCHKCDVPACVNPEHLFVGSHQDNIRDAWVKGRLPLPPPRYGEKHHNAAFTAIEVREIRRSTRPHKELAERFGVHPMTIKPGS